MLKHQVTDKNSLASKDLEDVQSKKETGGSSWKREKERKRIHPKKKPDQVKEVRSSSFRARTLK